MRTLLFFFILLAGCFSSAAQRTARSIQTRSERDLIPEGIAVDPKSGTIYVSSINRHMILAIDRKGRHRRFIPPQQDGYLEGLGMKVDRSRGWVWAVSNQKKGDSFHVRLHAFDLASGNTVMKAGLADTLPHLFNDLELAKDGSLFITDTYHSALYRFDPATQQLSLWFRDSLLRYPNGIVRNGSQLYIATYHKGILRLDIDSGIISPLPGYRDTAVFHGLDGLVQYRNTLYAVYNFGKTPFKSCLISYRLSEAGDVIVSEKIVEQDHPDFAEPTTAALYRKKLYVVANSHLAAYNANKESTRGVEDQLRPLCIRVYRLD